MVNEEIHLNKSEQGDILFLTNNKNALVLYNWLKDNYIGSVYAYSDRITLEQIKEVKPQLVISYNYNYIIREDIIKYMNGNIVNLHISFLPWNRGFSPNIWSFIDGTPKGVTIHYIDSNLDTGDITAQKELQFDITKESFASTYNQLNAEMVELFKGCWDSVMDRTVTRIRQKGIGSYHNKKDLEELQTKISFSWEDNIEDFLNKLGKYNNEDYYCDN